MWFDPIYAEQATEHAEQFGYNITEAFTRYEKACAYGIHGTEKPNSERFMRTWLLRERVHIQQGTPFPGQDEPITADTLENVEAAFEKFWEAYPLKEARTTALAAFKQAVTKATPLTIITCSCGVCQCQGIEPVAGRSIAAARP